MSAVAGCKLARRGRLPGNVLGVLRREERRLRGAGRDGEGGGDALAVGGDEDGGGDEDR